MRQSSASTATCGRMGQRIVQIATRQGRGHRRRSGSRESPPQGKDIGELVRARQVGRACLAPTCHATQRLDVLIDFSLPEGTMTSAALVRPAADRARRRHHRPHAGAAPGDRGGGARNRAGLMAPNMSLAVTS